MTGPQHVGIVGCSPPGAALCFEIISSRVGVSRRPFEVSMHSNAFSNYMSFIEAEDWDGIARLMLSSARKLERMGAQFLIAPCNTVHQAFDRVAAESPLPWLHIAEEVALEARRKGYKRVALLGTSFIMEGPVYRSRFSDHGIELCVPNTPSRERVNRLIFDEMVHGTFRDEAREQVLALLQVMRYYGCEAAGLCCTELPILLKGCPSPIPLLDSTSILAQAALKVLLGERPLPSISANSALARSMM